MRSIRSFQDFTNDEAPFVLQLRGERVDVDTRLGEAGENRLAVAAIRRERLADLAVIGEGFQGALRHGVDREGRGERLHIEASEAFGSLVPVLAHSRRWARAPLLAARWKRGDASNSR